MRLSLGFSPCPNDTFIFDALVNNKIDTGKIRFDVILEDVQTLNQWAIQQRLAITKISYGVLPLVTEKYIVLNSGCALGKGVGPLLISSDQQKSLPVKDQLIAIPGEHTTAHLLFSLAYPEALNKIFLRYDEIENFVKAEKGLGVIIHENRFTYEEKGLKKIVDLGEHWEQHTNTPIPLGGIVAQRKLEPALQKQVDRLIKKSIEYAFSNYPGLTDYTRKNSQEMSEDVMRKHIDLYVNDYSLELGTKGKEAIMHILQIRQQNTSMPTITEQEVFLERL